MHYKKYKSILSASNSMNLYRGCTHGCIYCDSRSDCYGMDHDLEDIEVKENAPEMLEQELRRKRKKVMIGTGSMCDPYMHIEREIGYTRKSLEVIEKYGFGATLITKSADVLRDLDVLKKINEKARCVVQMTLTTYDEDLCKILEPNVSTTRERFEALRVLNDNGIETVVWLCPILPMINDTAENLRGILSYCFEAQVKGIIYFGAGMTLRDGNREYFYRQLDRHFPGLKERYRAKYADSYSLESDNAAELMRIFTSECLKHGVIYRSDQVFNYIREFPEKNEMDQLSLF